MKLLLAAVRRPPNDEVCTPRALYDELDREFHFTRDVAAQEVNALAPLDGGDALTSRWAPGVCWMNPPYSNIGPWAEKAALEARAGAVVVGLLPVWSDRAWWHQWVIPCAVEVRFLRGRVQFQGYRRGGFPWPCCLVVWR